MIDNKYWIEENMNELFSTILLVITPCNM